MSFRNNAYAMVWEIRNDKDGNPSQIRISTSKKKQEFKNGQWVDIPGQYETDFSGFVFLSRKCAEKAKALKPRDRIQLTNVDVVVKKGTQDPSQYVTYFRCFDFEIQDDSQRPQYQSQPQTQQQYQQRPTQNFNVDIPEGIPEELPFN